MSQWKCHDCGETAPHGDFSRKAGHPRCPECNGMNVGAVPTRIVAIAARNIRPGDTYILDIGLGVLKRRETHIITNVERIDYEDRICVRITYKDMATIGYVEKKWEYRLHHRVKVRRTGDPSFKLDFTPKTNK